MKRIAVCDDTEYGRRVTEYLIRSLPGDVRIHRFTSSDRLLLCLEEMDLYLMEDSFYKEIVEREELLDENRIIFLSDQVREGAFCKWNHPARLVELLEKRMNHSFREVCLTDSTGEKIAVYCPFPYDIRSMVTPFMKENSLFLGFEDIGPYIEEDIKEPTDGGWNELKQDSLRITGAVEKRAIEKEGNFGKDTSDLSYYIRLREERISEIILELASKEEGRYFLNSPGWYFDLVGLEEEDFQWFFQKMEEESRYSDIYMAFGNSIIPSLSFFQSFDRLILLDLPFQERVHRFCQRFARAMVEQGYFKESEIQWESVE